MFKIIPILLFILLFLVIRGIKIVPQQTCFVIERLGKYMTTWDAGLHILWPIDKIAKKVSLKEQVADFDPQDVITKDNVTMEIDMVLYYKIFDPCLYAYGVAMPINALDNLSATTVRNTIGNLELDQTLTSRDKVNSEMKKILDEATDAWGIKITRCEVKNIVPPQEIRTAMEKQMKAEREKRRSILEAEAHKESTVLRAQGDKDAAVIQAQAEKEVKIARAQAEAESIRLIYEAEARGLQMLKEADMDDKVITVKKLEALKALGDGQATKIIVPTDLSTCASDLTFKSEMLGLGESIDKSPKETQQTKVEDACCDTPTVSKTTKDLVKAKKESKSKVSVDELKGEPVSSKETVKAQEVASSKITSKAKNPYGNLLKNMNKN